MEKNRLYQLAFEFKATKLWKKIWETQLFAVRHSDGSIGYCSVWGMLENPVLVLYTAEEMDYLCELDEVVEADQPWVRHEHEMRQRGIRCALINKDMMPPPNLEEMQAYCKANGVRLRGANACPSLEKLSRYRMPWVLDAADEIRLAEALEAAIEVAGRLKNSSPESLGIFEGDPWDRPVPLLCKKDGIFQWSTVALPPKPKKPALPAPRVTNELLVARINKMKKSAAAWNCMLIMHPKAMLDTPMTEDGNLTSAPMFGHVLLIQDASSGLILQGVMVRDFIMEARSLCEDLLNTMLEHGRPAKIVAPDERTKQLIFTAASQVRVPVEVDPASKAIYNAVKDYYIHFDAPVGWYDDDDDPGFSEERATDELEHIVLDLRTLSAMPDDVLKELMHMLIENPLKREIVETVFDEWMRRFLR